MIDGIIGKKIGMTQMFPDDGRLVGMTAIEAGPCIVTQVKTEAKEGYNAVQLGFDEAKKLNKPEKGHLNKLKLCRKLREIRVKDTSSIQIGQIVDADVFKPGDIVDIIGISKGRGFAGVVKRHHFAGGPKTHGQSDRHRAPGSVGANTSPGRVFKGLRMAGHMGDARVTVRNLEVIQADAQRHLLMVKGAVPGGRNGLLLIKKSRKA
jgi:large subunit ribosomal protein L3